MPDNKPAKIVFNRYPFFYILIPFIAGILCQHWFPFTLSKVKAIIVIILLFVFSGLAIMLNQKYKKYYGLSIIAPFLAILFFGFLFGQQSDVRTRKNWFGHQVKTAKAFTGIISETPEKTAKTIRIMLNISNSFSDARSEPATGKLLLYIYQQDSMPHLHQGDRLIIPNKLVTINNSGNPFEFDYAGYMHQRRLYYQSFLSFSDLVIMNNKNKQAGFIRRLRNHLHHSIEANIKDRPTKGLTEAILLNDRTLLDHSIRNAYSVAGISYIIAIAGLQVSILFGILLLFLRWIKTPRLQWVKYLLALPIIWLYIAITGFPPSAVRAAVMFSFVFLGIMLNKEYLSINFLLITAFLLLCIKPQWLFNTGVQLSFLAVASILLFFNPIKKLWQPKNKILKYLWQTLCISLAAQIFIFPMVLFYFHQFPLWFFIANVPAAIFIFLLMLLAILLIFISAFGIPCLWLGKIMTILTSIFHQFIFFIAEHTPQAMQHLYISKGQFWLILIGVVGLCIFIFYKKRRFFYLSLLCFCLLGITFITRDISSLKQQRIIVYNSNGRLIDHFVGKKCIPINYDSSLSKSNFQYVLLPARLGFGIEKTAKKSAKNLFLIQRQKVLILNFFDPLIHATNFPIQYLIVSNNCELKPKQWTKIFHPKTIILDGSFSRWKAKKWEKIIRADGLEVYNVKTKGAWIFPKQDKTLFNW